MLTRTSHTSRWINSIKHKEGSVRVIKTIKPSTSGAKRFLKEWGEKLIAVRYREDPEENAMYTTIEIIVDKRERPTPQVSNQKLLAFKRKQIVALAVRYEETQLRNKLRHYQAKWSKKEKLWLTSYTNAVAMGLVDRIVPGAAEKCTDVDMYIYDHNVQM
jgi:hypothetical protein